MYLGTMSNDIKYPPRMSLALTDEQRRLINKVRQKLADAKLDAGREETLKDFVWAGILKELAHRKWEKA